jgi:putative transposase
MLSGKEAAFPLSSKKVAHIEHLYYNKNMDVKRTKGAVYNLNYHLVWCPKYRCGVLTGPVADRLRQLFNEIATQNSFELLACEVVLDHVHLFVSAPPKHSPADLAKLFKGITSRRLRQELGEQIRRKVWKPGILWSPSYPSAPPLDLLGGRLRPGYVGTAGNVSGDVIKRYIEECQHI